MDPRASKPLMATTCVRLRPGWLVGRIPSIVLLGLIGYMIIWLWNLIFIMVEIRALYTMKRFYNETLGIAEVR